MQQYFEIGQIVNTVGLKGELKVKPFTDSPKRFDSLKRVYIESRGNQEIHVIKRVRYYKELVFITLEGIDEVEKAQKYKGSYIKISRTDVPKLDEDTYFIADLIGLEVFKQDGTYLGILEDVFPTGGNDVYVVKSEGKQILLPAISKVIKKVDILNKKMVVQLLEGMQDEV